MMRAVVCLLVVGALAPLATTPAGAGTFKQVYSFSGGADGNYPYAGLIKVRGKLYGTTSGGGTAADGTLFSVDPKTGAETIAYSFKGGNDGSQPTTGLLDVGGTLYGTTNAGGGVSNPGTVFAFDPTNGIETVKHSFFEQDGVNPGGSLIEVNGTLYGVTSEGGSALGGNCSAGCGTVYSIDPTTGIETVVHAFSLSDGAEPEGSLINVNGALYGTTFLGGTADEGTVYSVNKATGTETVLYSFQGGTDGYGPAAGLIEFRHRLYGTTNFGGAYGAGTVFSVNPKTGAEKVLHSFGASGDGFNPVAGLIKVGGTLYGTTRGGGAGQGNGTLFSVNTKTGAETVLHSFSFTDGSLVYGSLLKFDGSLYGTALQGGFGHCVNGCGTVFSFTP